MIALRPGAPTVAGDAVVIAVERISIVASGDGPGRWVVAEKRPAAVCVVTASTASAFDLDGSAISLPWLYDRVPGLEAGVDAARSARAAASD